MPQMSPMSWIMIYITLLLIIGINTTKLTKFTDLKTKIKKVKESTYQMKW